MLEESSFFVGEMIELCQSSGGSHCNLPWLFPCPTSLLANIISINGSNIASRNRMHALWSSVYILSSSVMCYCNSPFYFPSLYRRRTLLSRELVMMNFGLQILDTPSLLAEGSAGVRKNIFRQKPPESDASTSGCCWDGRFFVFFTLSLSFVKQNDVITWRWRTLFLSFTFVVCLTECSSVVLLLLIWYLKKMRSSFLFVID